MGYVGPVSSSHPTAPKTGNTFETVDLLGPLYSVHPLIFRWFRCPLRGQSSLGCSLCTLPAAAQSPAGTVPPAAPPPLLLRLPPAGGARARGTAFPATTFTSLTILRPSCADSDMGRRYAPQSSEQHLNLGVLNHLDHLTSDI